MSTTYKTLKGDTFEIVSRKRYGSEENAALLKSANPSFSEPFRDGIILNTPELIDEPAGIEQADDADAVTIKVSNEVFSFWTSIEITRQIDSPAQITVDAPFDSNDRGHRRLFKPLSYQQSTIAIGGLRAFTGTIITPLPTVGESSTTVKQEAYSKCAVIFDCTPPTDAPSQFNKQNLKAIASALCNPFGIPVVFDADPGAVFESVTIEPTEKVGDFLTTLAKQRNLLISDTPTGALRFFSPAQNKKIVARFQQGESPLLTIAASFKGQEFFSDITGIAPTEAGSDGGKFTVRNAALKGVIRPYAFKVADASAAEVKYTSPRAFTVPTTDPRLAENATRYKMGRMFASAAIYSIEVCAWRDPQGDLWQPDTYVELTAPDAMIYEPYEFLVDTVTLRDDGESKTALLELVFPGAYSGEIPERLPWE